MKTLLYILSLAGLFVINGCETVFFEEEPENTPTGLFEAFWTTYNNTYANFAERNVDWQEIYNTYRPQITDDMITDDLANIFKAMLRTLEDGHVEFILPNEKVYISNTIYDERIDDELFDMELIRSKYLNGEHKTNGYDINTYGWLEGNIGYLHMYWVSDNFPGINEILDYFKTADGLIIDYRHNGGGDLTWAFNDFGRFTDKKRYTHRSKTKNGPGPNDYSDWYEWHIKPSGSYFDKPIVVLTDRYTISAAERALMAFKTLPNVTQIGEASSGGLSTKIYKELQNGWLYTICPQKVEFVDGINYAGIGFMPDIEVKNTLAEIRSGQDKTLELAMDQFK